MSTDAKIWLILAFCAITAVVVAVTAFRVKPGEPVPRSLKIIAVLALAVAVGSLVYQEFTPL